MLRKSREKPREEPAPTFTRARGCFRHMVFSQWVQTQQGCSYTVLYTGKVQVLCDWQCPKAALAHGWMLTQSREPGRKPRADVCMVALWSRQHFSHFKHRKHYSSLWELLPVFLLCWAADSWCPVWIINATHGCGTIWILSSTCHEGRQHLPPLQLAYLFWINRTFVYQCDTVTRWSCTIQHHMNLV